MDDERKRKKFTLYLHPEKAADFQTLEAIESVPRSERGELFRNPACNKKTAAWSGGGS